MPAILQANRRIQTKTASADEAKKTNNGSLYCVISLLICTIIFNNNNNQMPTISVLFVVVQELIMGQFFFSLGTAHIVGKWIQKEKEKEREYINLGG